ncbi:hypothetical protein KR76_00084 [Pimelobacter simplex]|uniref:Uncharacterized protein n=1 Tax=Nocardioides simplex TaxID=2045 RepID=A0A0C5XAK0_NOCSI|nr:hypothetical protein KR76_00084 [Pimelobacter simplex]
MGTGRSAARDEGRSADVAAVTATATEDPGVLRPWRTTGCGALLRSRP